MDVYVYCAILLTIYVFWLAFRLVRLVSFVLSRKSASREARMTMLVLLIVGVVFMGLLLFNIVPQPHPSRWYFLTGAMIIYCFILLVRG